MKSSTRIELIDRHSVVSMPLGLSMVYVPHAVLIAVIALAWAGDGIFELASWIAS